MSLRHATLGLLSHHPLTGYDLKKHFDGSVAHFWQADQAQIYRTLAGLVADGLAEVRVVAQDGRPDRKEHRITAEGLAELDEWLASPLAVEVDREPFLARVFFAGRLTPRGVAALLHQREEATRAQLERLSALLPSAAAAAESGGLGGLLRRATLTNGIRHVETELAWIEEIRGQVQEIERP